MTYLVGQIIVCLLLAFLLGGLFGWLLRHSAAKKRESFLEEDLRVARARFNDVEADLKRMKIQLEEAEVDLSKANKRNLGLQKDVAAYSTEVKDKQGEIAALSGKLGGFEKRVAQLAQQSSEWQDKETGWQEKELSLQQQLDETGKELGSLTEQVDSKEKTISALKDDSTNKQESIVSLEEELTALQRQNLSNKQAADANGKELGSLQLLLSSQTSKTESALQAKNNVEQNMGRERSKQAELRTEIRHLQGQLAKARADVDNSEALHSRQKDKLAKQYVALEEIRDELRKCKAAHEASKYDVSNQQAEKVAEAIPTIPVKPAVASAPVKLVAEKTEPNEPNKDQADDEPTESKLFKSRPADVDDLKLIKGVGPKLEGMLHGLGIYQFAQIAKFTDKDLAWVDDNISAFKGRAKRDQWVAQAAKLLK